MHIYNVKYDKQRKYSEQNYLPMVVAVGFLLELSLEQFLKDKTASFKLTS